MYIHQDNAEGRVVGDRTPGGQTIFLDDASKFGSPSSTEPLRVSIFRKVGDDYEPITILRCVGRLGNALAIDGTADGYADADCLDGDYAVNTLTAGDLDDLADAIAAVESTPGEQGPPGVGSFGLTVPIGFSVGPPLTASGVIAISTSLAGMIWGTGSGFGVATPDVQYVSPTGLAAALAAISLTPGPPGEDGAKGDKGDKGDSGQPADESNLAHLAGVETFTGVKTLATPVLQGGVSITNSVGSPASGFDVDGYGFIVPMPFVLARNVDLTTGTDLTNGGFITPAAGKFWKLKVQAKTNGASGGFSLQVRKNGVVIFIAAQSVAASTTTVQSFTGFSVAEFAENDVITIDCTLTGTGVQNIVAILYGKARNL